MTVVPAASGEDTDAEQRQAYWRAICQRMPPMSPDEIAAVAVVLRRIDNRRRQQAADDDAETRLSQFCDKRD